MGGFLPRSVSLYPECAVEASALADHRTRAHLAAVEQRGRFHRDASTCTAIPRFASVITLAK